MTTLVELQELIDECDEMQTLADRKLLRYGVHEAVSPISTQRGWRYNPAALPMRSTTSLIIESGEPRTQQGCLCGRSRDGHGPVAECGGLTCPTAFWHTACMSQPDKLAWDSTTEAAKEAADASRSLQQLFSGGDADDADVEVDYIVMTAAKVQAWVCKECQVSLS